MEPKLYVGNLPFDVSAEDLRTVFSQAGEVKNVSLIMDRNTSQSKGFAFVEMATQLEAEKAIKQFNHNDWSGRELIVSLARPKTERSDRTSSGGSRRRF